MLSGDRNGVVGRENAHNVDLNRNFPDQFTETAENKIQEPETLAVMSWIKSYSFQLSANLHGGSLVSNYPFDDTPSGQSVYSKSPDDAAFRMLAESYSLVSYSNIQNVVTCQFLCTETASTFCTKVSCMKFSSNNKYDE